MANHCKVYTCRTYRKQKVPVLSATVPRFRRPQFLFVSQGSQAWDRWDRWERWDRGTAEGDFHRLRDRPVHWWPLLLVATWYGSLDLTVSIQVVESFH